ncbi:MAG: nuclease, partial [Bacteroidia bacterium]|nr:nuclease [Bacteroidia bacterium]
NCPETNPNNYRGVEYMGLDAKNYVKQIVKNEKVRLEFDEEMYDQYGRTLAYVFLEDGTLLNEDLISRGLALVYTFPPNTKYLDRFEKAERKAKKEGKGIWSEE